MDKKKQKISSMKNCSALSNPTMFQMYWAASLRKLRVHSLMNHIALRKDVSELPQEGMEEILSREWLTLWIGVMHARMGMVMGHSEGPVLSSSLSS